MPIPTPPVLNNPYGLQLVAELQTRKLLASTASTSALANPIVMMRGDLLKCTVRFVTLSGVTNPPLYRVDANTTLIHLGDGKQTVYVNATGIAHVGTGDEGDPRMDFTLSLTGAPLDAALTASGQDFITALLQINALVAFPTPSNNWTTVRQPVTIYQTDLYPLP